MSNQDLLHQPVTRAEISQEHWRSLGTVWVFRVYRNGKEVEARTIEYSSQVDSVKALLEAAGCHCKDASPVEGPRFNRRGG